jgi:hypothetical protein
MTATTTTAVTGHAAADTATNYAAVSAHADSTVVTTARTVKIAATVPITAA